MQTCNNVVKIQHSEFLANSLFKLNTNYSNLDKGLCQLGKDVNTLREFVRSLTVKDSPTIDMSFSLGGYFLSADVFNNSLGTIKLGQDIPQTTKVFLTGTKVSSLIDVKVINVNNNNALRWDGSKWINSPLTDEFGAQWLYDLKDCSIKTNQNDQEVLKYDVAVQRWISDQETGLSAIPNGDYEDIYVSDGPIGLGPDGRGGPGTLWKIEEGVVTSNELSTNSVATSSISALQVTNNKFANRQDNNGGIPLTKCAFDVGEVNRGVNVGTSGSVPICVETNTGTRIPIKTIKGINCTVTSYTDTLVIKHDPWPTFPGWPPPRIPKIQPIPPENYIGSLTPAGSNLGTGLQVFNSPVEYTSNNPSLPTFRYNFKTLKTASNSRLTLSENTAKTELTMSLTPGYMALSMFGHKADGSLMNDAEILSRLTAIHPPTDASILTNTTCSVVVETISFSNIGPLNPNLNLSIQYYYKRTVVPGTIINIGRGGTAGRVDTKIDFVDPDANWNPPGSGAPLVNVSATKNLTTTGQVTGPSITEITRRIKIYTKTSSNTWVLQSTVAI